MIKLTENLRSGLCKNALMTLNEISWAFRRELDIHIESAMTKLLKKSIDSNSFISDEVRRVMITIATNCSEIKVIAFLANVF